MPQYRACGAIDWLCGLVVGSDSLTSAPARHHFGLEYNGMIILIITTIIYKQTIMIKQTNAVTFRQNLGEMLNLVQYRHDSVLINKDGKPVAALIDARLFDRIRRMQARFDALCERIEAGYEGVDEAEGNAEIDAAVALDRQEQRKLRQP